MPQEDQEKTRRKRTLRVAVQATPRIPNPIRPRVITLTDDVSKVVWRCDDLPRGATLLIHFLEDPRGPFCRLAFIGNEVIGYGNRGPRDSAKKYFYEAAIQKGDSISRVDYAPMFNEATIVQPPPGPPYPPETSGLMDDPTGEGSVQES